MGDREQAGGGEGGRQGSPKDARQQPGPQGQWWGGGGRMLGPWGPYLFRMEA